MKAKTVAIIDDSTQYGKGLADEFEKTIKAAGVKVVTREASNNKATDFKAILTKVKGTKPDVIMYGGMDATGGPLTKQAAELGIKAKVVGGDGMCTEKLAELAGDAVVNVVCSEAGMALSKMAQGADFQKRYKERFNSDVQIYAPFTYDAVYVLVDSMKRANSTDPSKILLVMPDTISMPVLPRALSSFFNNPSAITDLQLFPVQTKRTDFTLLMILGLKYLYS